MRFRFSRALLALACIGSLAATGAARPKPTIVVMPTQYVTADAVSAANIAIALVTQLQGFGYTVVPMERSRTTFRSMRLSWSRPYAARVPIDFGRRVDAQLVVYPRLLSVGRKALPRKARGSAPPVADLQVRVYNVRTGKMIYSRQVRGAFQWGRLASGALTLPPSAAATVVTKAIGPYFERIAGSRQELSAGR
jgi:hypothetical protein